MFTELQIRLGQIYRSLAHVSRFREAVKNPRLSQERKLLKIIDANKDTCFGKIFDFGKIRSIADFQQAVPALTYEEIFPYIDNELNGLNNQLTRQAPFMFATTSGTTDRPKFIPITADHIKDYTHAFQVFSYQMAADYPDAARGRYLIISSNDEEGKSPAGIPYGAISGVLNRKQPAIIKKFFAVPYQVSRIKDVQAKYYAMLRISLAQNVTAILCCNPSSLLLLSDMMIQNGESLIASIFDGSLGGLFDYPDEMIESFQEFLKPDRDQARVLSRILERDGVLLPRTVWTELAVLSCWKGGPLGFYLNQLPQYFGDIPVRDFGYMASEGRGTIPLHSSGAGGVLAITSHFFEFVKETDVDILNKQFYTADELELGQRYYVFFTTASGLYRYDIKDLIEVVDFFEETPVIQFVRKSSGFSSITGEKLTEEQVRVALSQASQESGSNISHFTAAVELSRPPRYVCYVELKGNCERQFTRGFLTRFDESLKNQNPEYKDKRDSMRLGEPWIRILPQGTRTKLVQQRVTRGAPEAQVKIPLLLRSDDAILADLKNSVQVPHGKGISR